MGPRTITPRIPEMTGEPPTRATARESVPNQGFSIYERVMEMALKRPKYRPNANNNSR